MDENHLWDRQEEEPSRWYQRFNAYRLAGPGRSIEAVYRAECEARRNKVKRPSHVWYDNAERWSWKARAQAWDQHLADEVELKWREQVMGEAELLARLSQMARVNIGDFVYLDHDGHIGNINQDAIDERGHLVKKISSSEGKTSSISVEMYDAQQAMQLLGKHLKLFTNSEENEPTGVMRISIPARLLAKSFIDVNRDVEESGHMEYLLKGGRGSTKSSFASLAFVALLVNNPDIHGVALRQVANTLRNSVYAQIVWAVTELDGYYPGLRSKFKFTTSPLEITYLPTEQKVFFLGANEPEKIKSTKTKFGYVGLVWLEELDQFKGPEAIRKIEQSLIRGGDIAWEFKTYNPPPTASNWVNKYVQIPKANQLQHHSDYRDVPKEWLGQPFLDEAEHLKNINERAYKHEYLGEVTGTGGQVFENLQLRKITDAEISAVRPGVMGR